MMVVIKIIRIEKKLVSRTTKRNKNMKLASRFLKASVLTMALNSAAASHLRTITKSEPHKSNPKAPPPPQDSANEYHHHRNAMSSEAPSYEYTADPGACRTSSGGTGSNGSDYVRHNGKTYDTCKELCDSNTSCVAFEFGSGTGPCEIWSNRPEDHERVGQLQCYHKIVRVPQTPSTPPPHSFDNCREIHRRHVYGSGGDLPETVTRQGGWKILTKLYHPFGYEAPDPPQDNNGAERWWKFYATYWHEEGSSSSQGDNTTIQIKFDLRQTNQDPVFTLPSLYDSNDNGGSDNT